METRFRKVYLEIGNICNLQCSFCPVVDREKHRLEQEQFRSILREIKPHTDRVCFHLMGEPLSHPQFAAFVGVAEEEGIPVEITTNGTLLNPAIEDALLRPGIHQVNFSLQSFFDNFPGVNPDTYLEKIFRFCQRALAERPDLYINFRLWNLTAGATEDVQNETLLKKIEARFGVEINRRVEPALRKSKKLTGRLYLHHDTRFEWPHPSHPERDSRGSCQGTRTHVGIHADGTVVPCCLDKEARLPLGKVGRQKFSDILGSPRFLAMRAGFEKNQLVEELCRRCDYSRRF